MMSIDLAGSERRSVATVAQQNYDACAAADQPADVELMTPCRQPPTTEPGSKGVDPDGITPAVDLGREPLRASGQRAAQEL